MSSKAYGFEEIKIPKVTHPTDKHNFFIIHIHDLEIGYSYSTPIAFNEWDGKGWVVRVNDWSNTTGKHLNWFEVPANERIPGWSFMDKLIEACNKKYEHIKTGSEHIEELSWLVETSNKGEY